MPIHLMSNGKWFTTEKNLEYFVDHYKDDFYIITNDQAKNFRLMKTPVNRPQKSNWAELIPIERMCC
ncbi:MAG: hypothetical protein CM15mP59_2530 [Flavobacteriaceae bacterium]|nr:MAG: hypothetical protein CM15mP59_2530 [Flavobacteriaceae bacterium]